MNPLPTGTATSWRKLDTEQDHDAETYTYVFEGLIAFLQGPEFLAEQIRQDGAASSLGAALSMSENAELSFGWLYLDEDTDNETIFQEEPLWAEHSVSVLIAKVPFDD